MISQSVLQKILHYFYTDDFSPSVKKEGKEGREQGEGGGGGEEDISLFELLEGCDLFQLERMRESVEPSLESNLTIANVLGR